MQCPKCAHVRQADDVGPDYECPKCGVIYAKYNKAADEQREALAIKVRGRAARDVKQVAVEPEQKAPEEKHDDEVSPKDFICSVCGSVGKYQNIRPGSTFVEVLLWLCWLIPGVMYSSWRNSKQSDVCTRCHSTSLILVGSPVGRDLLARTSPDLRISNSAVPKERYRTAGEKALDRIWKMVVILMIVSAVFLAIVLTIAWPSH